MRYYSLNHNSKHTSFKNAVIRGLAPDRGLYFPNQIPILSKKFFEDIEHISVPEMAFQIIKPYVGKEIDDKKLLSIVTETLDFEFPTVEITDNIAAFELFHGPTLAFKDVGARFMARALGHFSKGMEDKTTVLVATSGDTGGAVANGFLGVDGVEVIILYPKGKISEIQEKQITTLGQNITALEVDGVFDDCQEMVKAAFLDPSLTKMNLTSANSINVARWLPQMFYYFICYKKLSKLNKKLIFSVPSGNFGNLCSGILAKKMGLPIHHFIASTNINDIVPKYIDTGIYSPKPSKETISNAMDVGDPSNFIRIERIFNDNYKELIKNISGYKFSDIQTRKAISNLYGFFNYTTEPHGAIAYMGLKKYLENKNSDYLGVFLGTAHPIKFREVVENEIKTRIKIPSQLKGILSKEKKAFTVKSFQEFKSLLLN